MSVLIRLIIILVIFSLTNINAKEAMKHAIKAELTVRLINHITWEDERRLDSFNLAFFGDEPDYYNSLKKATSNRKIRRKAITITKINNLQSLDKFQLLVVAEKTEIPFSQIALAVRQTNTLVVSENQPDQIYIMINFLQSEDNTYSFELNRSNILLEQLSISKNILLLGGTELDVAKLYREMEEEFSTLTNKLSTTQKQSEEANRALLNSQSQLNKTRAKLTTTQSGLKNANKTLERHINTINVQEETIKSRQIELEKVIASADENKQFLKQQSDELTEQTAQIKIQQSIVKQEQDKVRLEQEKVRKQQEKVKQNDELLLAQQEQLLTQKSSIENQQEQIKYQKILILVSFIALSVFLILVFWLYRINKQNKQFSLELERRGEELEDEVKIRTEDAIKSEQHYKTLAELSPVGVYQIDTDGNCIYINERWCEYSGLTRQQAIGKGWVEALHPFDRKRLGKDWIHNLNKERVFNGEHRYRTQDGQISWLLGQCNVEYDKEGKPQGYIGAVTDITEQKHLEEQLRRTQKMDALGKLTGGIAHDYNNMLTIISGYAELLQKKLSENPDMLKYVQHIIHSSERGAALTKKLLTFSKHVPADAKSVDINSLLEYQHQMLRKTLTPRIELKLVLDNNLWPLWLDVGDLEDALVNMSINAMHAMETSGSLTIETKNQILSNNDVLKMGIKPGDYVLLQLTDTGTGMDEETLDKLFDPFFSTKGAKGTGLGLSQVYSFVKSSNGAIKVHSKPNEGTRISIYFPRHLEKPQKEENKSEKGITSNKGHETILIVDDENALLELNSEILSAKGYKTIVADNGVKALEIIENNNIDLLLSDIIMPEMDGYQLAEKVQSQHPEIKIILISGYSDTGDGKDAKKSNIKNFIQKPFNPKALLNEVRTLLDE